MRYITLIILFFIAHNSFSQGYTIQSIPNRIQLSYETVKASSESDLGFVGIGFEFAAWHQNKSSLYLGINSYSAVVGNRPGLITLGLSGAYQYFLLPNKKLSAEIGGFIGGGGGGGADDGGGLIIRPYVSLEKKIGPLGIRFGYSFLDFPTGSITGNQFNIGFTLNGTTFLKSRKDTSTNSFATKLAFQKLRIGLTTTQYFNFKEGSFESGSSNNRKLTLVGIQVERNFSKHAYGIFKINGALDGGGDGYMSILLGAGGKLPIIPNLLNIESRVLIGPSGGGGVLSGGGATMQTEAGLTLKRKEYYLKFMYGKTFAPWGNLNAKHIELTLGKSIERIFPKLPKNKSTFTVPKENLIENQLSFSTYNRTYFSPKATDKGGRLYNESFNLIGFEIEKFIAKKISVNGGTVWAYEGDYGAYAEGLIGVAYRQSILHNLFNLNFKVQFGAAGGGGIDIGSGLIFQYNAGIEKKIGKRSSIFANFGKYQPLKGNFDPLSLDIGFKIYLTQLLKKQKQ